MGKKEKEDKKPKVETIRTPRGMLPRKQREKPTSGYKLNGREAPRGTAGAERYCPSKRIKSAHRKLESKISLRVFAETHGVNADWLRNKSASGRGY